MKGDVPADFEQDESGKTILAPERFKSAEEVAAACSAMVKADSARIAWRAEIDNLIDGNPVYSLASLRAKGQGWRARVNYRGAEGLLQARQTPFYDLVTEVNPCVDVCLDYGKGVDQSDWAAAIAKHFHWMLMKAWRSEFNFHLPVQQLEMLKHGIGYHVWPGNKNCWIPRTPTTGTVLFPDGATLNLREDLDYFMLRDWMPGHAIYAYIRNEAAATKLGWNVDSVWSALAQSSKNQKRANASDVETFQREMRRGDIGTSNARQSGLWLNTLFVKEIDTGKISQYTVAEGVTVNAPKTGSRADDPFRNCLFRKRNRFDDWPIVMFPYDIGRSGDVHSIRGLGARTKDFFSLDNRLTNAMVDQVLVGSTMTLKQTGAIDPDKLRLMRLGMMSIIPQGLEAMSGLQFPNLAQGPIALRQELKAGIRENNESYSTGAPEPMDRETAQSFTWRAQDSAQIGKGALSLYNSNLCQFYDRVVRIACRADAAVGNSYSARLAKEFQDRCVKDGVPKDAMSKIYEVSERTSTGAGSPAARIQALMTLMKSPVYANADESRKINLERDFVSALVVNSQTDRYARNVRDNELPDSDASLAVQENNGMAQGGDALVASSQNHVEHLGQHLGKANEIVQAVQQGQMDPAQALAAIQKLGQHCAQHLQQLQGNPMRKQEFDELHREWLALSAIADQLQQQVAEMQQAEQQPSPEEQISDNLKIGLAKVNAGAQLGQQKFAHKAQLDEGKFRVNTGIKLRQAAVTERLALQRNGGRPAAAAR